MISFRLLDFEQPTIVQHFGACIFYDTIRERWEECLSNEALVCKYVLVYILIFVYIIKSFYKIKSNNLIYVISEIFNFTKILVKFFRNFFELFQVNHIAFQIVKIKETLLEKLAFGAPFLNQSVTNKLTSSLAIFILYCMPDIWSEPIQDLVTMWNDKPELLLR